MLVIYMYAHMLFYYYYDISHSRQINNYVVFKKSFNSAQEKKGIDTKTTSCKLTFGGIYIFV